MADRRQSARCPDLNVSPDELETIKSGVQKAIDTSIDLELWESFWAANKHASSFAVAPTGIFSWNGTKWVELPCSHCYEEPDTTTGAGGFKLAIFRFPDGSVRQRGESNYPFVNSRSSSESITSPAGLDFVRSSSVSDGYVDNEERLGAWRYKETYDVTGPDSCTFIFTAPIGEWRPACDRYDITRQDSMQVSVDGHALLIVAKQYSEEATSDVEIHYDNELRFSGTSVSDCTIKPIVELFPDSPTTLRARYPRQ